jgi:predicted permease
VAVVLQRQTRGATSRGRARNVLVVAQVAVAMVLLFGGGLLTRSLIRVLRLDPGFSSRSVLTMHFAVTRARYPEAGQVSAYEQALVDRIAAIPGVEAAAFINRLPLSGLNQTMGIEAEAPGSPTFSTDTRAITPQYFEAMRIPILHGRTFANTDTAASPPVLIVDEAFARRAFGTTSVAGKRIRPTFSTDWSAIVGVVGHIRNNTPEEDSRPQIYFAANQRMQDRGALVIRTQGDPTSFTSAVIAQIHAEDPDQPVYDIRTMEDWMGRAIESRTFLATLVSLFSATALAVACLGVFGVVAYSASLRSREFGIRMALGAVPGQIRRTVLRHAGFLVAAGLAIGGILLWPVSRLIENLLFGIEPNDPFMLLAAPALLATAGLAAAILPARRAGKADPAHALRQE